MEVVMKTKLLILCLTFTAVMLFVAVISAQQPQSPGQIPPEDQMERTPPRDRDPMERGPRDRLPRDRDFMDRDDPLDRDPMNRGPMDRDPRDRGPIDRRMDRGPMDRGPMDEGPMDQGPGERDPRERDPRDPDSREQDPRERLNREQEPWRQPGPGPDPGPGPGRGSGMMMQPGQMQNGQGMVIQLAQMPHGRGMMMQPFDMGPMMGMGGAFYHWANNFRIHKDLFDLTDEQSQHIDSMISSQEKEIVRLRQELREMYVDLMKRIQEDPLDVELARELFDQAAELHTEVQMAHYRIYSGIIGELDEAQREKAEEILGEPQDMYRGHMRPLGR